MSHVRSNFSVAFVNNVVWTVHYVSRIIIYILFKTIESYCHSVELLSPFRKNMSYTRVASRYILGKFIWRGRGLEINIPKKDLRWKAAYCNKTRNLISIALNSSTCYILISKHTVIIGVYDWMLSSTGCVW